MEKIKYPIHFILRTFEMCIFLYRTFALQAMKHVLLCLFELKKTILILCHKM